jgi:hypothetical protein
MQEFYCKDEDIPKCENSEEFIRRFIILSPATYYVDTNELHCNKNKYRSITDIFIVARQRYHKIALNKIIRVVMELCQDDSNHYVIWYCGTINKYVIGKSEYTNNKIISDYTIRNFHNHKPCDELHYEQLLKIKEKVENC